MAEEKRCLDKGKKHKLEKATAEVARLQKIRDACASNGRAAAFAK